LQSIQDLNGNTITVTPTGITSSAGNANITFARDGTGRITDIYDLNQPPSDYHYSYDASGNLQSVQHPGITQPETYTYLSDHSLQSETDFNNKASSAVYYSSANDGGNTLLDGRLFSITDTMQQTTSFSYTLSTNTTTTTFPDGGVQTRTDDSFGKPLSITDPLNRTTTYRYDSNENLISMTDAMQPPATTNYTYDANGFQTSIQLPGLPADSKTYNQFGGITSQTDAAITNTIITMYDANFNPISVTDKLNGTGGSPVATFSNFDAFGNFQDSTDANGKASHYDYFQSGQFAGYLQDVIRNLAATPEKTSYTYDAMGKVLTVTDACGNGSCPDITVGTSHTTTNLYDALERLSTVTDATGVVTRYLYDNNSNKTDEYDDNSGLQRHTQWAYDNLNRVSKITYADGTMKQFSYDFRGNKLTEVDQLGRTTKNVYDLAGQLTSVTYAFGTADAGTVSYTYDADGRPKTITDENNQGTGLHTTTTYDPAGRLTSVQDPLGNLTSYGYDADGRRTSVTEPNNQAAGLSTTYTYDPRGRVKVITYPPTPTQPTTTMQYPLYDGMGRVLTALDQGNIATTKTYDNVGRLKTVTDALTPPNTTTYIYDLNGNLQSLKDANQHTTSYQYDNLNRRAHRILPLSQIEDYSYDVLGRLKTKIDFNRKTTTYNYDSLDRILSKVPDPSLSQPTNSFTYTLTGQRLSMTDPSGTTNYPSYNNRDRLLTKATPEGTLTYTYDAHGNLLTIVSSNANGASLAYQYDALNRLSKVCDNRIAAGCGAAGVTTYTYDATGNLTGYVYPNTVQTANLFDPLNRLTQTCSATSSPACSAGTKLSSYLHGLAPAGNRLSVTEANGRLVSYLYDNDYRLTKETIQSDPAGNNGAVSYTLYDAVGNRQTMSSTLNAVPGGSFSYDNNDRLTTDLYDANGNTTSFASIQIKYDFENRMTQYGTGLLLAYDGDGNRISETIGGTTTKFLVDDHNPTGYPQVLDELVNASVTRTYAYGRQRISENQLISGTWTPSFYGYDGHGNARFLTNSAGAVTDSYDYDAFGMPIRTSGTTPNTFLYSGERSDNSIGLYDLRARYYDQATGRFWSFDPYPGKLSRPSTLHKYAYTANNPVNYTDPTGQVFDTTALWFKAIGWTVLVAVPLGEILEWAFACEGHAAASAVPGPLPPLIVPGYPTNWFPPGGGGATIGPAPPPAPPNIGPPCTIATPRPHLGQPPQGPPTLGPSYWPNQYPGGGPLGPRTGPGEAD
jgi:RHS repeat-associated protein